MDTARIRHPILAGPGDGGRIDAFLARRIGDLSRSRIKVLIAEGHLTADGETILDPSRPVKPGTAYHLSVPPPVAAVPEGQDLPLDIVYEDEDLIVIIKPAGLVVHPAPGNPDRTLVNALIHHCGESLAGIGGVRRPGIVHRLDKGTSGLMVAAKTEHAHAGLVAQFSARSVRRAYVALVWGIPAPTVGRIEGNIGRSPRDRKRMGMLAQGGRPAATNYRLRRAIGDAASEVECRLETGRTHQIRVHMAAIGHPVVADALYGGRVQRRGMQRIDAASGRGREAENRFPYQALHAFRLGFRHPRSAEPLNFTAPFPPYFNDLIRILEGL